VCLLSAVVWRNCAFRRAVLKEGSNNDSAGLIRDALAANAYYGDARDGVLSDAHFHSKVYALRGVAPHQYDPRPSLAASGYACRPMRYWPWFVEKAPCDWVVNGQGRCSLWWLATSF